MTKLLIAFYSMSGTNREAAAIAARAAQDLGADVRMTRFSETVPQAVVDTNPDWSKEQNASRSIPVVTAEDVEWATSILFVFPTRFGTMPAQVKAFVDGLGGLWFEGKLANKAVSVMTSAQNPHGGQEATLLSTFPVFAHWGAVVVTPGYVDPVLFEAGGNPYGYSHTVGKPFDDVAQRAIAVQVKRLVDIGKRLSDL